MTSRARTEGRRARHEADSEEAAQEVISTMSREYLQCRTLGHAWNIDWWGPARLIPGDIPPVVSAFNWEMVRVATCLRCGSGRDEFYPGGTQDPWEVWRVQYRRYRYSPGYQLKGMPSDRRWFTESAYTRWQSETGGKVRRIRGVE